MDGTGTDEDFTDFTVSLSTVTLKLITKILTTALERKRILEIRWSRPVDVEHIFLHHSVQNFEIKTIQKEEKGEKTKKNRRS